MIGNNINTASLSTYVSLLTGKIERERELVLAVSHISTHTAFRSICYVLIASRNATSMAKASLFQLAYIALMLFTRGTNSNCPEGVFMVAMATQCL